MQCLHFLQVDWYAEEILKLITDLVAARLAGQIDEELPGSTNGRIVSAPDGPFPAGVLLDGRGNRGMHALEEGPDLGTLRKG